MSHRPYTTPAYVPPRPRGRPRKAMNEPGNGHNPGTATAGSRVNSGGNRGALALQAVAPLAPRLLDLAGAAAYMAVSPWTIRQWEAEGALPRVRISLPITNKRRGGECRKLLFDRADLDQLIERSKESAP